MTDERHRRAGIVGYWRAVELFSAPKIPPVSPRDRVYEVTPDRSLPWEAGHALHSRPLEPGYVWQHVVYGGTFSMEHVRDTLLRVFGESGEDFDGRMDGESSMFALTIDDEGCLVDDSPVFSTCAWATGRTLTQGPGRQGWLKGFDTDTREWHARAAELGETPVPGQTETVLPTVTAAPGPDSAPDGSAPRRRIATKDLLAFARDLADAWGVAEALNPYGARVLSVAVRENRAGDADQQEFLNSFIAADLDLIAGSLAEVDPGAGLAAYLTPGGAVDTGARIDLRRQPETALDRVAPQETPVGRWPADPRHPLALSQQFAVNTISGELSDSAGLFAVNGPPGTGKTTMLRDCFADNIVRRAVRLADLRLPSQAFIADTTYTRKNAEYGRTVRPLIPQLTGFEMVVASANNGAVENISTEIPARSALGPQWREEADYFAEQATRLLAGSPAWGAVAARLGSKKNRIEFVNRFWNGKEKATDAHVTAPDPRTGGKADAWLDSGRGLAQLLDGYANSSQTGVWREARNRFRDALEHVERLRAERQHAATVLRALPGARNSLEQAHQRVTRAGTDLTGCRSAVPGATVAFGRSQEGLDEAVQRRRAHFERRPGFVVSLFTLGKAARTWHHTDVELAAAEATAHAWQQQALAALRQAEHAVQQAEQALGLAERRQSTARTEVRQLEDAVRQAHDAWADHVPQDSWLTDDTARELSAPWADEELTCARSELFFSALGLHQAFLRCTAKTMYRNLMAAMDAVTGSVPATVPESHLRAAWQSLFLVVPVVSTTFASLDRVFGRLGSEALGWLFIDEAGQATPQMAVGGMWRARRTVVVGDPLQLEPVVTLPWTAQRALRDEYGVAEEWAPGRTSVQQVADRTNRYGTLLPAELPDGSLEAWVGSPLRVHRRCDDPMFTVSNAIAYDDLMVYGTPDRGPYQYAPGSCWVDVPAAQANGHWVLEEGRAMRRILERLRAEGGVDLEQDVYVISPFRKVVDGARVAARGLLSSRRVGTIHTTQGKEADVVILILGTDPQAPGARAWAAQRPNLLNVAASRAKRRLFVIGNREVWREQRYFSTLAETLPAHTWQEPKPPGS
ncbi:DEAD/DEAH box helicase [Streptomyces sp. NPDC002156]